MSNLEYSGTERHELSQSKEKTEDGRTVLAKSWERSEVTVDTMQDGGSSKSTSGVWLSWTDLKVEVDVSTGFLKKERKQIVRGSNARARPGEVMAVMGPSGAGKSTLFNALALRGQGYHVSGDLTLNGLPYTKVDLKAVSGFVFQDALMHSMIKVKEELEVAAELKLPRTMTKEDKARRVQTLIDAFDLKRCENTKVSGISGGEKKRLSIAVEVLPGPSLLFLDEPTTGLDAASSLMVLQLLRQLADAGTNVIMVLHQPRANVLKYIDNFLILSDGRDVFYGSLPLLLKHFESIDCPIPLRTNPVDYVLDVINTNENMQQLMHGDSAHKSFAQIMRGDKTSSDLSTLKNSIGLGLEGEPPAFATMSRKELASHLSDLYRQSGIFEQICANDPVIVPPLSLARQPGSSLGTRFRALLKREFIQKLRNPEVFVTQVFGAIVLGLVMGSIYYQMPPYSTFNITSGVSFGALMTMFLCFHLILLFPNERKIWLRDRDNGLYGPIEYYCSVVISGLPGDYIAATILGSILYWMFGLRADAGAFFTWLGFFYLLISTASALLYMGGAVSPSTSVANSLVSVILLFVMVFNGFFIVVSTIGPWFRWIAEINFMRFALNTLYFTQFSNVTYNCTGLSNCMFPNGDAVLVNLGIPVDLEIWRMAVYILIVLAIFHILALLAICFCYTGLHHELAANFREKRELRLKIKLDKDRADSKELVPV